MRYILLAIVVSQFFCTSLWFAGNAILPDLISNNNLEIGFLANLTSAVQFGFITGTLFFAVLTIADRFSPSLVFFACSIVAALCNLGMIIEGATSTALLWYRFLTGFFLAGIYPVGMKIASDHYQKGLGKSLGFLVGALVLGTALPHLLKSVSASLPWKFVVISISSLSVLGGMIMLLLVSDGPYRKKTNGLKLDSFVTAFRNKNFRSSSFGYFGHMWELYTFWAFVPVMLSAHNNQFNGHLPVSFLSFLVIGSGGLACVAIGLLSDYFGPKKLATWSLFLSCACCLLSPVLLFSGSTVLLTIFLVFWGLVVIADSPMFSSLVAQNAPVEFRGTALTIVNCIGFAITIFSIQFLSMLSGKMDNRYVYMLLAIGPLLGLIALLRNKTESR
jgi:MFS family permease